MHFTILVCNSRYSYAFHDTRMHFAILLCVFTILPCTFAILLCTFTILPCAFTILLCTFTIFLCNFTILPYTFTILLCAFRILPCTFTILLCSSSLFYSTSPKTKSRTTKHQTPYNKKPRKYNFPRLVANTM